MNDGAETAALFRPYNNVGVRFYVLVSTSENVLEQFGFLLICGFGKRILIPFEIDVRALAFTEQLFQFVLRHSARPHAHGM